jgi:predicted kinase
MAAILTSMSNGVAIIVAGPPAAGKTTLAGSLAPRLGIPLLSKDIIKETLFDSLGTGSLEWSQQLGGAAFNIMFALANDMHQVMLEAYFQAKFAAPQLHAMNRPLIQIYCRCPIELAVDRYRKRITDPKRHPGHLPEHQLESEIEKWASISQNPLELDAPLFEVDTTKPIDFDALTRDIYKVLSGQHRTQL